MFSGEGTTGKCIHSKSSGYELLAHPKDLEKLRDELAQVVPGPNDTPSISQVDSLPFLNAIINEVVRLHPGRTGKDYLLPSGTLTTMSPFTTHMNADAFENTHEVWPQRWINNPKITRGFLGFSRGTGSRLE
ncbi:cytochrome P450 [Xylaria digitata]|nr:cytochrome P450 [Xylaria digitata]